jgi:hypothetical protein
MSAFLRSITTSSAGPTPTPSGGNPNLPTCVRGKITPRPTPRPGSLGGKA